MNSPAVRRAHRAGFTFVELCVVTAILAVFATLVIPSIASARASAAGAVEQLLEADLRRARTEALARAQPVAVVAAADGSAWWIAEGSQPSAPIAGSMRVFGRGALVEHADARLTAATPHAAGAGAIEANEIEANETEPDSGAPRVFARFDALGSRDEGIPTLTLTESSRRSAQWTLPAGRTRLER